MERRRNTVSTHSVAALVCVIGLVMSIASFTSPRTQVEVHNLAVVSAPVWKKANDTKDDSSCSCDMAWNASLPAARQTACCRRTILLLHKMGVHAMRKITRAHFRPYYANFSRRQERILFLTTNLPEYARIVREARDSRSIIVTRHWTDALISGYLYHRTGRECWLDNTGNPRNETYDEKCDYDSSLLETSTSRFARTAPRFHGRCLCQYLAEESEEIGIRVYTEVALDSWYRELLRISKEQTSLSMAQGRTLFVCYENVTQATTYSSTVQNMAQFLFPALAESSGEWESVMFPNENAGGHATSHDHSLRTRLATIIQSYDREVLAGEIAEGSAFFGCRSELEDLAA